MKRPMEWPEPPDGTNKVDQSELIEALESLPAGAHQLSRAGRFKMAQDIKRNFHKTAIITALRTAIKLRDPYWMMVYRAALGIGR